jgi:hypothetical protein
VEPVERPASERGARTATWRRQIGLLVVLVALWLVTGCGDQAATPTRTPFPTWTPTPLGGVPLEEAPADPPGEVAEQPPVQEALPPVEQPPPVEDAPTPVPTDTPLATETPTPEVPPTPTDTPEPSPTPTSAYTFVLEAAEKFPTDSLAPNVVRIFLYAYSPLEFGLEGYSLLVTHNGVPLVVDEVSAAGAPDVTRTDPSPFTRFTNMSVLFVEPQTGRWEVQLIDAERRPVGPPAVFELTADEITRELYVRYRQE